MFRPRHATLVVDEERSRSLPLVDDRRDYHVHGRKRLWGRRRNADADANVRQCRRDLARNGQLHGGRHRRRGDLRDDAGPAFGQRLGLVPTRRPAQENLVARPPRPRSAAFEFNSNAQVRSAPALSLSQGLRSGNNLTWTSPNIVGAPCTNTPIDLVIEVQRQ